MKLLTRGTRPEWRGIDGGGAAAAAAISLALYFAGVAPLREARAQRAAQQAELDAAEAAAAGAGAEARQLGRDLDAADDALAHAPIRLASATAINRRHADLARLAGACGLEIHGLQPRPPQIHPLYQALPVHLGGSGTYHTVAAFLHRAHAEFPDIGVASFELSGNPAAPADGAALELDLLWYAAPSTGAGGPAVSGVSGAPGGGASGAGGP